MLNKASVLFSFQQRFPGVVLQESATLRPGVYSASASFWYFQIHLIVDDNESEVHFELRLGVMKRPPAILVNVSTDDMYELDQALDIARQEVLGAAHHSTRALK